MFQSHSSPIVVSVYVCPFHSPFPLVSTVFFYFCLLLSSIVILDCFFCRQVSLLFAVCFCTACPPILFYCASPVVSPPSLYSPTVFALSEHHLPICRFLVPPFLHRAQPSLTRLCLNRIPPFSSSFLSINTWSLISSLHRIPPPFLLPAIFLLFSLCLYSWCQFHILFPISLFCSFCLMVRSLCSLCVFMVHVLVWGLR